jgi:hypothetical protein
MPAAPATEPHAAKTLAADEPGSADEAMAADETLAANEARTEMNPLVSMEAVA